MKNDKRILSTHVKGAKYTIFNSIAKTCPEVSRQLTIGYSNLYRISSWAFSTSIALIASMPKVSPALFRTFSASPSSPAALNTIFFNKLPIPAGTVADATAEETVDVNVGSAEERLCVKR